MLPSVQRAHPGGVNVRIASCEHIGNSHRCGTRSAISHDVSCCGDLSRRAAYEAARRLWNASIDKHPGLIVRCTAVPDCCVPAEFSRRGRRWRGAGGLRRQLRPPRKSESTVWPDEFLPL